MSKVQWKIPGIFKADADSVDREIKSIGDKTSPKQLLDYARENPDSELHKCFEWNDSIAAEKYRVLQAQKILQFIVRVPDKPDTLQIREYQITSERNVYQPTRLFLSNEDEYENLLKRALRELQAFKAKYAKLSELETIIEAIDEVV